MRISHIRHEQREGLALIVIFLILHILSVESIDTSLKVLRPILKTP